MNIACPAAFATLRGALLLTALTPLVSAQSQIWIRQFGTAESDHAHATTPDRVGGAYVAGSTWGDLGTPSLGESDAWLARYDSAGNRTWLRQFGSTHEDEVTSLAPDGAGGVYVSGVTWGDLAAPHAGRWDIWLARYDGAGNQIWARQFGTDGYDIQPSSAPDGVGGVYVSGTTERSLGGPHAGGRYDAFVAHYDAAGNQSWITQFGAGDDEYLTAAAPDGVGGVYVSGFTDGSFGGPNAGTEDAWLARYNNAGTQIWIRQFGTTESDRVYGAAPDGVGGVYICGNTWGSLGGPHVNSGDAWLARYDDAGNQTWITQFGTFERDRPTTAAADGAGGVYMSGYTISLAGPNAGDRDAWLARYNDAGSQIWIRQFGTPERDESSMAAPDGSGGVYVSGGTLGSLGGPNAGVWDAWFAHYENLITLYCTPAVPNSTGQPGVLAATGSTVIADNDFAVAASEVPQHAFGFFLTSMTQGFVANPGGSQGSLCLGGSIGRFVGPGEIMNSGTAGSLTLAIDLGAMPTSTGLVAVQPGQTWNFQAWYRDANPTTTSNFTDAVAVTFQ